MSLTSVRISEEVWLACLTHALTTETEEIMGLLLGDIQQSKGGATTALIWGASPQVRSDRRKDRVETNPEQLAAASAQAERMTLTTGRTTRVIGWYHSHPHHTVLPSHVDVRTQAMYQLLDPGFVGLIFSCFSEDSEKVGRIQVIAFQSLDGKERNASLGKFSSTIQAEPSWSSSENAAASSSSGSAFTDNLERDTGDSRVTKVGRVGGRSSTLDESFAHADAGRQISGGNSLVPYNSSTKPVTEIPKDSVDMSPSLQEALHRSNMDVCGQEYDRKEVPLQVVPARSLLQLDSALTSFTDMQHVLFQEERSAYQEAISQSIRDGKIHPLAFIHHTSTYQASLCKLMEYCLNPGVNMLQERLKENEIRLNMLMEEANLLEAECLSKVKEANLESPRRSSSQSFGASPAVVGQREVQCSAGSTALKRSSGVGSRRKAY